MRGYPFTIANAFNDYFTNIDQTLANKIPCTSKTIDAFKGVNPRGLGSRNPQILGKRVVGSQASWTGREILL